MFEMLDTLSNPPQYKEAISSLMYLFDYTFGTSEIFLRKLASVYLYQSSHDKAESIEEILKGIAKEKREKVQQNLQYGFDIIKNIEKWIILVGNDELIKKATWLNQELSLTDAEIQSILGINSWFYKSKALYLQDIHTHFKCVTDPCGNELIYTQLIDQSVSNYLITKQNMKELLNSLDSDKFFFNYPPEMNHYFEYMKLKDYEKNKMTVDQLKLMLDPKEKTNLYEPSNMITLMNLNRTQDLASAEKLYKITTTEQLAFVVGYFCNFLPENYIYSPFEENKIKYKVNPLSKAYSSLMSSLLDKTYGVIIKNEILYKFVLQKMMEYYLLQEDPNICAILLQRVVGDGRRVLKICTNPELGMKTKQSIDLWVRTYICLKNDCQTDIRFYLKISAGLSDAEMNKIFFTDDSLGKYFNEADLKIRTKYECGDKCTDKHLGHIQYISCRVTMDPPEEIKDQAKDSISEWDGITFPEPIELKYFQKKAGCKDEDCSNKANEAFANLYGLNSVSLNQMNSTMLKNKLLLEKMHTLLMNDQYETTIGKEIDVQNAKNFFNCISDSMKVSIFKDMLFTEYPFPNAILIGNNIVDKHFIDILKSGSVVDYYNPEISQTTGFVLSSKERMMTDKIVIETQQSDKQILRAVKKMNNAPYVSIHKMEYSSVEKKMINVVPTLFPDFILNETNWFSDGFQYNSEEVKEIYYYDELSAQVFKFDYENSRDYQNISCFEYKLNTTFSKLKEKKDIATEGYLESSQRFNKPFVISAAGFKDNPIVTGLEVNDSFICVDPYSNLVVESNLELIYSVYGRNFNYLNSKIESKKVYPLLHYKRNYSMEMASYSMTFDGLSGYKTSKLLLIIFGVIFIAALLGFCVFFWCKHLKSQGDELESKAGAVNEVLVRKSYDDSTA